jgi:hypothetical protein
VLAGFELTPTAPLGKNQRQRDLLTRRQLVLSLVATIKTINEQIKQLECQIATVIRGASRRRRLPLAA